MTVLEGCLVCGCPPVSWEPIHTGEIVAVCPIHRPRDPEETDD